MEMSTDFAKFNSTVNNGRVMNYQDKVMHMRGTLLMGPLDWKSKSPGNSIISSCCILETGLNLPLNS